MIDSYVTCIQSLVIDIAFEDDDVEQIASHARTVPDSVELTCGSHFHCSVRSSSGGGPHYSEPRSTSSLSS